MKARWLLFSGEYKKALKQYEIAFEYSLYRTCNVRDVLNEGLSLAAKERDRPLMKRLKNQAIAFGIYNLPGSSDALSGANYKSNSHVVEDWEVEQWSMAFTRMFPEKSCFPDCIDIKKHSNNTSFIHHVAQEHFNRVPDLKNPNRRLDVGVIIGGNKRRYYQLIWHTDNNHPEHVQALLEAGAKVDFLLDTSDSALLLAILEISKSGDRRCFDLLKVHRHRFETMNIRTDKQKRTALLAAVETGLPDVVKTVLDMGAKVDRRGKTDDATALNQCLKYINTLKSPAKAIYNQMNLSPNDPVLIDSVRRSANGMLGLTDAEIKERLLMGQHDPKMQEILSILFKNIIATDASRFDNKKLDEICNLLLERGADPNAIHTSPVKGYTPLMLAVENDEAELVTKMLSKGGDPYKAYFHGTQQVDCWMIAREFGASRSLGALGERKK
ncbi:MAG: hypothetical protein OFPII_05880 [Osedax symbiont Rs1]|nr:MAG: hypothetical protein OFPII_05880 [Osedax symbiont Rs1]